jgi:outer membrane protein insertion porin family
VVDFLRDEGFIRASIETVIVSFRERDSSIVLDFQLRTGRPSIISGMELIGASAEEAERERIAFQSRVGSRFRPSILESDLQAMLQRLDRDGFPLAKVRIQEIREEDGEDVDSVTLVLEVEKGNPIRLQQLRVEGNKTTSTTTILREARFREGDFFRGDYAQTIKRRLERSQFFSFVSEPELFLLEHGSGGLSIQVRETEYNSFDGVAGYVPAGQTGSSGYLTGLLAVQFRNLLGTGRKFSARWAREDRWTQDIQLRYREPWLVSLPLHLEGEFGQRKQDTIFVRTSYFLGAELPLSDAFSIGAMFGYVSVIPSEAAPLRFVAESRSTTLGVSLLLDSRDNIVAPTAGARYRTEVQRGSKRVLGNLRGDRTTSFVKWSADVEYFVPLFPRHLLAGVLAIREIRTDELELSDIFRIGGTTTLRGYREGQFLGSRAAWTNFEYRIHFSRRAFVSAFVDGAYIALPDRPSAGIVKSEQVKIGYGLGVRMDSPLGLLGIYLALGERDTFSTAKLHIQLINEF